MGTGDEIEVPFFFVVIPSFLYVQNIAHSLVNRVHRRLIRREKTFTNVTTILFYLRKSPRLFQHNLQPIILGKTMLRNILQNQIVLTKFPRLTLINLRRNLPPNAVLSSLLRHPTPPRNRNRRDNRANRNDPTVNVLRRTNPSHTRRHTLRTL